MSCLCGASVSRNASTRIELRAHSDSKPLCGKAVFRDMHLLDPSQTGCGGHDLPINGATLENNDRNALEEVHAEARRAAMYSGPRRRKSCRAGAHIRVGNSILHLLCE